MPKPRTKTTTTKRKTTKTKAKPPAPFGMFRTSFLDGVDEHPIVAAYKLGKDYVIVVERYSFHAAYTLRSVDRAQWLGYVDQNGPSRHKLAKAIKLDAKAVGEKLKDQTFALD